MHLSIPDAEAMEGLGAKLAACCPVSSRIYLQGELGSGKTTLVRGFLRQLNYQGKVKSPTYTLIEPYLFADVEVYHFDLYRINDPLELETIGLRDYFDGNGICLIEWPERAADLLGDPDVMIYISMVTTNLGYGASRDISLQANTSSGKAILDQL